MAGHALWPILDIGDRSPVGYEALERPAGLPVDPVAAFEEALSLVPLVNPAVLLLRADPVLVETLGREHLDDGGGRRSHGRRRLSGSSAPANGPGRRPRSVNTAGCSPRRDSASPSTA